MGTNTRKPIAAASTTPSMMDNVRSKFDIGMIQAGDQEAAHSSGGKLVMAADTELDIGKMIPELILEICYRC
jgi:hypothetical protein